MKRVALLIIVTTCFLNSYSQENVGIGTLSPNGKAILELMSTDKGFLPPRMTTVERINISPTTQVGLLVYDTDEDRFYYWDGNSWEPFPDSDWILGANGLMYAGNTGNVGIGTSVPQAKLHTIGTLKFQNVQLGTYDNVVVINGTSGEIRQRTLGDDIWDGDDVNDADSDPMNEYNTSVSFNSSSSTLTIIDGGGPKSVQIPLNANDNDPDSTNEIQDLSSSKLGNNVTVNISNGLATTFSIDDGDSNPSNELQTLSMNESNGTVTWSLSQSGGSGSFSLNDDDWISSSGDLYPSTLSDQVGIGNSSPSHPLDVTGNALISGKTYIGSTDYYLENNNNDLLVYSTDDIRLQTNNDHDFRLYESGSEAIANFELDGEDVLTLRGNGSSPYYVGIGTANPVNKLQVDGDARIGLINPAGFTNGGDNYGNLIYFSGGPGYVGGSNLDSDNSDLLFMSRYNVSANVSELRVGIGDDYSAGSTQTDRFSIGATTSGGGLSSYKGLFEFEINNPGSSTGPMLSISPYNSTHVKDYHGGLTINKPIGNNGQYINLTRQTNTVWSIGYQYGGTAFAIDEGTTSDASFANSGPDFTILKTSGYVGLGVSSPVNRLELPNENSANGRGRAFDWITYSDGRFKKNREAIGSVLSRVMQMEPMTYQWEKYRNNEDGLLESLNELKDGRDIGFIAQDLYKLFPEVVSKPEDESKNTWSVSYQKLSVILTRAIQEQQKEIVAEKTAHEQTKAELDLLKSELEESNDRIDRIETLLQISDAESSK